MTRPAFIIFIVLLAISPFVQAKKSSRLDSLLVVLDKEIVNEKYKEHKENELSFIRNQLNNPALSFNEQYTLYSRLTNEYEFYRCDSAYRYAQKLYEVAELTGKKEFVIDSKIKLASILFKTAMFDDAIELLDSIDEKELTATQRFDLYKAYYEAYVSRIAFYEDGYAEEELDVKLNYYYDAFLAILVEGTYEYASYYGIRHINNDELNKAESVLYAYLPKAQMGTRPYSIVTSVLSFLYERRNDAEKVKESLALSALSDIKGSIMDNLSLRTLASMLYEEGDLRQANSYIKKSMDDANFYNARIRNIQNSKVLSIIDKAYQVDRAQQQRRLVAMLVIISVLSVFLLVGILFIIRQMKKLSKAKQEISGMNEKLKLKNQALEETNLALADTNHIKEEYIGHFLGLCSLYIEKMEKYQRKLFNKAKTSTAEELYKTIKSTQFIKDEREEFYNNFDDSFLKLFPNFVEDFNALLPEEERIVLKVNEKLSTELRIFALIRLGITDSNKIAEFLNYSLATIYNYRSRLRNKALVPKNEF
ncbi:DUF6377 domain-containing protein, partial [Bacteroides sp. OttesenSCG-928-E20]|nr:DUF6377 domain-containing protein [Bacteroides sp. OttesenSCG-928-N06]MDL2299946.1 DUF6377 domain-containing protein [Bacteroides sp. OttesenSCG-928-E20]